MKVFPATWYLQRDGCSTAGCSQHVLCCCRLVYRHVTNTPATTIQPLHLPPAHNLPSSTLQSGRATYGTHQNCPCTHTYSAPAATWPVSAAWVASHHTIGRFCRGRALMNACQAFELRPLAGSGVAGSLHLTQATGTRLGWLMQRGLGQMLLELLAMQEGALMATHTPHRLPSAARLRRASGVRCSSWFPQSLPAGQGGLFWGHHS